MSRHQELEIYKTTSELVSLSLKLARGLPRDVKQLLGQQLLREVISMLKLVPRANRARADARAQHIEDLLEALDVVMLHFRVMSDERFISRPQHAETIRLTTSIGKQAGGWLKHSHSQGRPLRDGQGRGG